jgi:glutamyl/glutaminyl-tRNA synthetase
MTLAVNAYEAHASGGKFIMRFDNDQPQWNIRLGPEAVADFEDAWIDDLEWLGVEWDECIYQKDWEEIVQMRLMYLNKGPLPVRRPVCESLFPELTFTDMSPYPYTPHLTAEKVVMDWMNGVNLVIRGWDLLDEFSHYCYFCDLWGIPQPRQVFLPRLMVCDGENIIDISKTAGNYGVAGLREKGLSPAQVWSMVEHACLKNPCGSFSLDNLKTTPLIHEHTEGDRGQNE